MVHILFVCHGNICRSPMAEFVMRDLAAKAGVAVVTASAATSDEEIGNPVHPGTRHMLAQYGIRCNGKTARRLTRADYEAYDYLIAMDRYNRREKQPCFCPIAARWAMWRTHGIPAILKAPGGT